jgi:hypothetical protein
MNQIPSFDPALRRRNRIMLVLLVLCFVLPLVVAVALQQSGWRPQHTGNRGALLQPPVALADIPLRHADGSEYHYAPQEKRWQIVVVPPVDCGAACSELIEDLGKVWQLQGRRADRLQVLWFGPVPAQASVFRALLPMQVEPALTARLPGLAVSGAPSAYLIDPRAFLVLHYAPGFDPGDLRADVAKLLK